jgi:hypothetical protein
MEGTASTEPAAGGFDVPDWASFFTRADGSNPIYDFLLGPQAAPQGTIPLLTAPNSPVAGPDTTVGAIASLPWYVLAGLAFAAFVIVRKL